MCRRKVCGDLNGFKTHLQHTACLAHSMLGISAQVHEHLLELCRICEDGAGYGLKMELDSNS